MAPIKFEEQLKDKLEKRELSPSSDSWSKLAKRLDNEDKKSKKPIYWWLSIAAGLVILVAVSIQFLNRGNSESVTPKMVEEKVENPKPEELKSINNSDNNMLASEEIETKTEQNIIKNPELINYKKAVKTQTESDTKVADNKTDTKPNVTIKTFDEVQKELQKPTDEDLIETAMAAAMKALKSENPEVTDREVDSLLKLASKELFKDKLQDETIKTVSAESLLQSVEEEMGQSFRSKVFDALKESFETVKTAVAERNN